MINPKRSEHYLCDPEECVLQNGIRATKMCHNSEVFRVKGSYKVSFQNQKCDTMWYLCQNVAQL